MHAPLRHPHRRIGAIVNKRRTGGFVIIEALIALLIFSIGALGLIGLQVSLMRSSSSAKYRAEAAYLASDLLGTMWSDAPNLASYAAANCDTYNNCSNWKAKVAATLPAGTPTLTVNSTTGLVSIKIVWTIPQEGSHSYITSAAINR